MTDLSKIDFTELKLEPIVGDLYATTRSTGISLMSDGLLLAYSNSDRWALAAHVSGYTRAQIDELWKRTEQVDEFIRQKSRRRITVLELARELVDDEREISVALGRTTMTYRFNRDRCAFQYHCGNGEWLPSKSMGRHSDIVTIIDWPPCPPSSL